MVCSWWNYASKPSACPLKFHKGLMCLRRGVCVPVAAGSCWGGTSGALRCAGTSLGAPPHLSLFESLIRAGFVLAGQMHLRGTTAWRGVREEFPRGLPRTSLSASLPASSSTFVHGDKSMPAPSPSGLGELWAVPQPGEPLQGTESPCVAELVAPHVPWVSDG